MMDGPADKSYGIHVAKIAGLPDELLSRASAILAFLESGETTHHVSALEASVTKKRLSNDTNNSTKPTRSMKRVNNYLYLVKQRKLKRKSLLHWKQLNLLEMTPMDALNKLYELQKQL